MSPDDPAAPDGATIRRAGRPEWLGLAVLALPCIVYAMDLTVLNLAVPQLSAALGPSSAELLWIIDIYGFMVAGCLVPMGALGDRVGRRRMLLIGAAAFGAASIAAAFATSAPMLIAARALLGIAGATLAPSTLSLIRNMFLDPGQRTIAIGVWVTSYSVGSAIGPLVGGFLLQYAGWSAVFLASVPVMALLLIVGPRLLPEFKDPTAGPIDLRSVGLSLGAVLLVIHGLKRVAEAGGSAPAGLAIAGGAALGLAFVQRQRALRHPLIDLRLFEVRAFRIALATYALATFAVFGVYIFIAQYLQLVAALSPFDAGLAMVPATLGFIAASMTVPAIARRVRATHVMSGGLVLAACGFAVVALVAWHGGVAAVVVGSVLYSIGICPVVVLATDEIVGSAPAERAGAASALSETGSELGGALGIAILGSIGVAAYRGAMADAIPWGVSPAAAAIARATLGGAATVARSLPPALGRDLTDAARDAFTGAFALVALISAGLAAAMAVVTLRLGRARATAGLQHFASAEHSSASGAE